MLTLKSDTPLFGNSGATITLLEYSDFACEHCRDFHNDGTLDETVSSSSGSVNRMFKNVPNQKNPESMKASRA